MLHLYDFHLSHRKYSILVPCLSINKNYSVVGHVRTYTAICHDGTRERACCVTYVGRSAKVFLICLLMHVYPQDWSVWSNPGAV